MLLVVVFKQCIYLDLFFLLFFCFFQNFLYWGGSFFFLTISYQKRMPDRSIEFKLMNLSPAYRKGSGHVQNYKTFQATLNPQCASCNIPEARGLLRLLL